MGLKVKKLLGEKKQDAFGYAIATGDLNGDGVDEIVIASTSGHRGGTIYIYSSKSFKQLKKIYIGKKKVSTIRLLITDINQDDINELVIAVTYQDLTGEVKVFSANENKFLYYWKSTRDYDAFGFAIATGDVNGDGHPDLIISAPQPIENGKGRVYVYSGKDGSLIRYFTSMVPREHIDYGTSVAAGDINGDGVDEVIIGAPGMPYGEVLIYSGQHGWLVKKLTGDHPGFGVMVHADDLYDDGQSQLIVTTKNLDGNHVSVFGGPYFDELFQLETEEVDIGFGETLTTADVNGDGNKEIILGAFDSHHKRKKYTGQVNVYDSLDGKLLHRWYGKDEKDQFGFALSAGTISNGERKSIIIGAPREMRGKQGIVYISTIS